MAFNFEAEPRVVHNRAKYRTQNQNSFTQDDNAVFPNLMKDTRIRHMTPAQQEEEFVRIEKERIKLENMHEQLANFKKNKKRTTPYDIKPSPNPRIDVNLTFFLTDANNVKAPHTAIDTQTDKFQDQPPSPKYIPKKTGKDVETQVEDGELFNFDREVFPIVDVIITKTLEQSMLEIEEEEEIKKIHKFKQEYVQRRQKEEKAWREVVQKEIDIITRKNKILEEARKREEAKIALLHKVQAFNIAKSYIRDISFNSLNFLYNNGYYHDQEREALNIQIPNFLIENLRDESVLKEDIATQLGKLFGFLPQAYSEMRKTVDEQHNKKAEKKRNRRVNYEQNLKRVRILYQTETTPSTFFTKYIQKFFEGSLEEYLNTIKTRTNELQEKVPDDMTAEEAEAQRVSEFPELGPQTYFRLQVNDIPKLFFSVAQNMYYETMPKTWKYDVSAVVFNMNGDKMYTTNKSNPRPQTKSMKYYQNIRDRKLKVSDDIGLKISLSKIEPEAYHILVFVEVPDLNGLVTAANDFTYARVRVSDFQSDQTFNEANLSQEFPPDTLKDTGLEEETKQSSRLLAYYLYRSNEFGWMLESVRSARNITGSDGVSNLEKQFTQLIKFAQSDEISSLSVTPVAVEDKVKEEVVEVEAPKGRGKVPALDRKKEKEREKEKEKEKGKVTQKTEETVNSMSATRRLVTRSFGPIDFILFEPVETVENKVIEAIRAELPHLIDSFEFGYEILIQDVPHVRPTQLRKIKDLSSFEIRKKPSPPEEPNVEETDPENPEGEGNENEEEEDDGDAE